MSSTVFLEVGQQAPDFTLRGPGGQNVSLSEYRRHKNVVIAFFPLAFSPVCSHQLPDLQRQIASFEALDAVLMGISVDSYHANTAFAKSLGVTFPLLSDFHRRTSADYGVLDVERGYSGRAYFVVDKQGRLVYRDVSPVLNEIPNFDRLLDALRSLR